MAIGRTSRLVAGTILALVAVTAVLLCVQRARTVKHVFRRPQHLTKEVFVGWRGGHEGRFPDAKPPVHWSATTNIIWKTRLPGTGNATPVLSDDRIFLTAEPTTLLAVGLDGKLLWQRSVNVVDTLTGSERNRAERVLKDADVAQTQLASVSAELERLRRQARTSSASADLPSLLERTKSDEKALKDRIDAARPYLPPVHSAVGTASSTPVTDGKSVFALFGNFVLASFDRDGNQRWARTISLPEDRRQAPARGGEGQAASLLLVEGRLIVPLASLHAFDPDTGDELWEGDEFSDFGTPTVVQLGEDHLIVTPYGRVVDVDGKTVAENLGDVMYASPITDGRHVFFVGDQNGRPLPGFASAARVPSALGSPFAVEQLWKRSFGPEEFYASPLLVGDHVLTVNRKEILTVLDAHSGETLLRRSLLDPAAELWASPALAGRYIYVFDEGGTGTVLNAAFPYETVNQNQLEGMNASPIFAGDRMYLRTQENLFCISESGAGSH